MEKQEAISSLKGVFVRGTRSFIRRYSYVLLAWRRRPLQTLKMLFGTYIDIFTLKAIAFSPKAIDNTMAKRTEKALFSRRRPIAF